MHSRTENHSPQPSTGALRGARTRVTSAALVALLAAATVGTVASSAGAAVRDVGAGGYTTDQVGPAPEGCAALATDARAYVTDDAPEGPVPTNDWWSSLLFKKWNCTASEPLHAHPLAYQPSATGLGLSYTTTPVISGRPGGVGEFHYSYAEDVLVGVAGLSAGVVEVADWTDWTVTASWADSDQSLRATIGHGLPFSWYHVTGGDAVLSSAEKQTVWLNDGETVGFTAGGTDYVAYAPSGSTWTVSGSSLRSTLGGKGYLSVASLPTTADDSDADRKALAEQYAEHAYAEVTGTTVAYEYDESAGAVRTTYALKTTALEGEQSGTVVSLYPHQSQFVTEAAAGDGSATELEREYFSPRGDMTTYVGATSFTTETPFTGVLPEIPAVATGEGAANTRLDGLLDQVKDDPMGIINGDTYWTGKALGRATRIAEIADQVGRDDVRDKALSQMKATLTEWFTATPGKTEKVFAYNENWGTLVGFPASYGSDKELNDHHFHYGYYIVAAATLARFDPEWASDEQYGGMVDLLIRDANNYDRDETRFPYLRDFDIYAGHDWASGHGAFAAGNNQESSSEGMNFANALIQWGEATGDTEVRDAGVFMYATQAAAIQAYWFNGADNLPEKFGHTTVGMVWGDGATYTTWFSAEPEMIQGINTLPITGGHLYLGMRPEDVRSNYAELVKANAGEPTVWQDILWEYLALGDAPAALKGLDANPGYTVEEGESRAHTYHWIANLAALGTLDTGVHGDHPLSAVFSNDGDRTYVAANVTSKDITVTFSDGTTLKVAAGTTATTGKYTWSGGSGTGGPGGGEPTPTPTASATPKPTATATPKPTVTPTPTATATPKPTVTPTPTPTSTAPTGFTLYLQPDGSLGSKAGTTPTATVPVATGADAVGEPGKGLVYTATGLTGKLGGGTTSFDVALDAGTKVGQATRVRVSYDLTGNGSWDRVETYRYFATDPVTGWERYTQAVGLESQSGALGDLAKGSVRVEIWNVFGGSTSTVDLTSSKVSLPFS